MLYAAKKLDAVHGSLVQVVNYCALQAPFDIQVLYGRRTQAEQDALYEQGRTRPGKIVTWTRNSKHITGEAVDLAPLKEGKIDWEDVLLFVTQGKLMLQAASQLGIKIRWGYDWDMDGIIREKGEYDGPHFELVGDTA